MLFGDGYVFRMLSLCVRVIDCSSLELLASGMGNVPPALAVLEDIVRMQRIISQE